VLAAADQLLARKIKSEFPHSANFAIFLSHLTGARVMGADI
jgi:hypothetical protein